MASSPLSVTFPATIMLCALATLCQADYVPVYVTNYGYEAPYGGIVNDAGQAVGSGWDFALGGERGILWNQDGQLVMNGLGGPTAGPEDINNNNVVVGTDSHVNYVQFRHAYRWSPGSADPEVLPAISTDSLGRSNSWAYAINDSGVIVGSASVYSGDTPLATRAVRWTADGTVATQLGTASTIAGVGNDYRAYLINASGVIAGEVAIGQDANNTRAVRWDAGSNTATELGNLGTRTNGRALVVVHAISDNGVIIGKAEVYDGDTPIGYRPVRWDPGSSAAVELDSLVSGQGKMSGNANAINAAGTIVGSASVYDETGSYTAGRAVRWAAGGTAIELLDSPSEHASCGISDINDAGIMAGGCDGRAALWMPDGSYIDLNTFVDPAEGIVLLTTMQISNTNWITGTADVGLGYASVNYLIHVPEPTAVIILLLGCAGLMCAYRSRPGAHEST